MMEETAERTVDRLVLPTHRAIIVEKRQISVMTKVPVVFFFLIDTAQPMLRHPLNCVCICVTWGQLDVQFIPRKLHRCRPVRDSGLAAAAWVCL